MKKLILNPILLLSLMFSTTASAQLAPSYYGGMDQCQQQQQDTGNPLADILQAMMLNRMLMAALNPPMSESQRIEAEIKALNEKISDLKGEQREERSSAKAASRAASEIEERIGALGCKGNIKKDPLICLAVASRASHARSKARMYEDRVDEIKDEIKDTKEEIRSLREAKQSADEAESSKAIMQALMPQMNSGMGMAGMASPQLSGQAASLAAFSNLQGTCPTCAIQPNYGSLPTQGIMPAAQNIFPILNQVNGVTPGIALKNAELGWPTLPYTNNSMPGPSVFGPQMPGCFAGRPLLPLVAANNSIPGNSASPIGTPFQPGQGLPMGPGGGAPMGIPNAMPRTVGGGQVPFQGTPNPQPFAR